MRMRHGGPSAIEIVAMPNWPMVQALVIRWPLGRNVVKAEAPVAIARAAEATDRQDEARPRKPAHNSGASKLLFQPPLSPRVRLSWDISVGTVMD